VSYMHFAVLVYFWSFNDYLYIERIYRTKQSAWRCQSYSTSGVGSYKTHWLYN